MNDFKVTFEDGPSDLVIPDQQFDGLTEEEKLECIASKAEAHLSEWVRTK